MTKDSETPEPVTAPTREERLRDVYRDTLGSYGVSALDSHEAAIIAVVLAAQGEADDPEPSAPAEPVTARLFDPSKPGEPMSQRRLEGFHVWAAEGVACTFSTAQVRELLDEIGRRPPPSAPVETSSPSGPCAVCGVEMTPDDDTHEGMCHASCWVSYQLGVPVERPEPGPTVPDAPGLWWLDGVVFVVTLEDGRLFAMDAQARLTGFRVRPGPEWGGPVVHPSTIAADRVQDIAEAHAEVEAYRKESAVRQLDLNTVGAELTELAAQVEAYRESDMAHRDEAARLHFAAAEYKMAAQANAETLTEERDEWRARAEGKDWSLDADIAASAEPEATGEGCSECTDGTVFERGGPYDCHLCPDESSGYTPLNPDAAPTPAAILAAALEHWGEEKQLMKLREECIEAALAVTRLLESGGRGTRSELASEVADVENMCCQARLILGGDLVDAHKRAKLDRLRKLLEAGGGL